MIETTIDQAGAVRPSVEIFVARQPIFDRHQELYGYELLFRSGLTSVIQQLNGDSATSTVLSNSFLVIGMDALTSGKRAFVNVTRNLLLRNIVSTFPKHLIGIELLEDIEPDAGVVDACRRLKDEGYVLALDDFVYQPKYAELVDLVDIVKVDFLHTSVAERERLVKSLGGARTAFLAEKVETQGDFQMALDFGYTYIQGFFFSKPDIVSAKDIPGYKLHYLQTLYEVNQPELDLDSLDQLISRDLSLSFKLLRFVNSAFFGLRYRISSIRHALILLGSDEIRKWASLVALTGLGQDKADELAVLSTVRAKFCELVADQVQLSQHRTDLYLMGLFSLMEAFTDQPMADILAKLPVLDAVKQALLGYSSPFGQVYQLVLAYEGGHWEEFTRVANELSLDPGLGPELYHHAIRWTNQIFYTE